MRSCGMSPPRDLSYLPPEVSQVIANDRCPLIINPDSGVGIRLYCGYSTRGEGRAMLMCAVARISHRARRTALSVGLSAALCASMFASATPARADHTPDHDPVTRLWIVVKQVVVVDDGDWFGKGEFRLRVSVVRHEGDCSPLCSGVRRGYVGADYRFSASSQTFHELDRIVPDGLSDNQDPAASAGAGIAVHSGEVLGVSFFAEEDDPTIPFLPVDFVHGRLPVPDLVLREQNGWSLGRHAVRLTDGFNIEVAYEVRRSPLPDLSPIGPRLVDDGGSPLLCVVMQNLGELASEPFQLTVRADGALVRNAGIAALDTGQTSDLCVRRSDLPARQHVLSFTVDEQNRILELNEANNEYRWPVSALPAPLAGPQIAVGPERPAGSTPPTDARADLTVEAIRVKGQEPSGHNDCDPGRNDVTVVVKNRGSAAATSFAVRVVVDGEEGDAEESTVADLGANASLEVTFDDIRLRRGLRAVTASVDAKKVIAEADEDNNELKISVNCRDD